MIFALVAMILEIVGAVKCMKAKSAEPPRNSRLEADLHKEEL